MSKYIMPGVTRKLLTIKGELGNNDLGNVKEARNEALGLASGNLAGQEWNLSSDVLFEKLDIVASREENIFGKKKATEEPPEHCKTGGAATDIKICLS